MLRTGGQAVRWRSRSGSTTPGPRRRLAVRRMEAPSMAGASIPQVTVVVPTRNRPALAARAVRSARDQRDVSVEVVVVDDGSEPALDASTIDATIVRHDRSQGVAVARNSGLSRATAPLVAFLDDDDLWAP